MSQQESKRIRMDPPTPVVDRDANCVSCKAPLQMADPFDYDFAKYQPLCKHCHDLNQHLDVVRKYSCRLTFPSEGTPGWMLGAVAFHVMVNFDGDLHLLAEDVDVLPLRDTLKILIQLELDNTIHRVWQKLEDGLRDLNLDGKVEQYGLHFLMMSLVRRAYETGPPTDSAKYFRLKHLLDPAISSPYPNVETIAGFSSLEPNEMPDILDVMECARLMFDPMCCAMWIDPDHWKEEESAQLKRMLDSWAQGVPVRVWDTSVRTTVETGHRYGVVEGLKPWPWVVREAFEEAFDTCTDFTRYGEDPDLFEADFYEDFCVCLSRRRDDYLDDVAKLEEKNLCTTVKFNDTFRVCKDLWRSKVSPSLSFLPLRDGFRVYCSRMGLPLALSRVIEEFAGLRFDTQQENAVHTDDHSTAPNIRTDVFVKGCKDLAGLSAEKIKDAMGKLSGSSLKGWFVAGEPCMDKMEETGVGITPEELWHQVGPGWHRLGPSTFGYPRGSPGDLTDENGGLGDIVSVRARDAPPGSMPFGFRRDGFGLPHATNYINMSNKKVTLALMVGSVVPDSPRDTHRFLVCPSAVHRHQELCLQLAQARLFMATLPQHSIPTAFQSDLSSYRSGPYHNSTLVPAVSSTQGSEDVPDDATHRGTKFELVFLHAPARMRCSICHQPTTGGVCLECTDAIQTTQAASRVELEQLWLSDESQVVWCDWDLLESGVHGRFVRWARTFVRTVNHRAISTMVPRRRSIVSTVPSVRTDIGENTQSRVVRAGYLVQRMGVPQISPRDEYAVNLATLRIAVFDRQRYRAHDVFKFPTNLFSCDVQVVYTSLCAADRDLGFVCEPMGYGPNTWVITTDDGSRPTYGQRVGAAVFNKPGAGRFTLPEILAMGDELLHARLQSSSFGFELPATDVASNALGSTITVPSHRFKGSFRSTRFLPMTMDFLYDDRALEIDFLDLRGLKKAFAGAFHANHRAWMQEAQGIMIQYLDQDETQLLEVQANPLSLDHSTPSAEAELFALAPPATVFVIFWGDVSPLMAEWHDLVVECGRDITPPRGMNRKDAFEMYDDKVLGLLRRDGLLLHGGRNAYAVAKRWKIGEAPRLQLLRRHTLMPNGLLCPKDPRGRRDINPLEYDKERLEGKLKIATAEAYDTMLRLLSHTPWDV